MSEIQDASGHKLATMGEDNKVRNLQNVVIGSVLDNGDVYNSQLQKVGNVAGNGYIYEAGRHVGTVHPDGQVVDFDLHLVGKVVGGHIESAGAALMLLVR